jgi:Na+-transporting NADH:ubiquinone oxidoreductase subunit F
LINTYVLSFAVFSSLIFFLVGVLLLLEAKIVKKGDRTIVINDDPDKSITVPEGSTLLSALVGKNIFLPSACGGGGSCGMCRCRVDEGGRSIMPTELAHLSRKEKLNHMRIACQVKVKQDMKIRIPDEIFNIQKYSATVVSNENVATFIKELVLQLDEGQQLDFEAGAYVQLDIPEYEIAYSDFAIQDTYKGVWDHFDLWGLRARADEPIYRAYSLANPPAESDKLSFTIRIATPPPGAKDIPPGLGSSYIFNLKPGDQMTLSGPYGDFFIKDTDREMCFIGGGAGMAPLRSQILDQLERVGTHRRVTFWYGARSAQEMFFDDDFKALQEKFNNFSYHVALSDPMPEDQWEGPVGFIHQVAYDLYLKDHRDPTEIEYYMCGPPMMLQAVKIMLDSLGVDLDMVAFDEFG